MTNILQKNVDNLQKIQDRLTNSTIVTDDVLDTIQNIVSDIDDSGLADDVIEDVTDEMSDTFDDIDFLIDMKYQAVTDAGSGDDVAGCDAQDLADLIGWRDQSFKYAALNGYARAVQVDNSDVVTFLDNVISLLSK